MKIKILKQVKHNGKEYRIIRRDYYSFHDEFGGSSLTDKPPTYNGTIVAVEVHKKFLFIKYWETIYDEQCTNKKSIGIITIKTNKWFNNHIVNG